MLDYVVLTVLVLAAIRLVYVVVQWVWWRVGPNQVPVVPITPVGSLIALSDPLHALNFLVDSTRTFNTAGVVRKRELDKPKIVMNICVAAIDMMPLS